jgi:hypothetical protein
MTKTAVIKTIITETAYITKAIVFAKDIVPKAKVT